MSVYYLLAGDGAPIGARPETQEGGTMSAEIRRLGDYRVGDFVLVELQDGGREHVRIDRIYDGRDGARRVLVRDEDGRPLKVAPGAIVRRQARQGWYD